MGAESHFAAALKDPRLRRHNDGQWKKDHPEVVVFLEDFATNRFDFASDLTVKDRTRKSLTTIAKRQPRRSRNRTTS